jgi:hypothetical protein
MRKSLLAGLAAATLLAAPNLAAAEETFGSLGWVTMPGAPLTSFDISWVDQLETAGAPGLNMYFLADRSNASIDLFHIQVNPTPAALTVAAPNQFAGNVPTCPVANACNGPNGVMTLINPGSGAKEMWVGDGPTMTPGIGSPVCPTTCSTVKVFNTNGTLTHVINTGGVFRADELCFVPAPFGPGGHGAVVVANDADSPPYINIIPTDGPAAYTVSQKIPFTTATNGIEQCQWDPNLNRVLLNVPEINGPGDDTKPGMVFTINVGAGTVSPPTGSLTGNVDITQCAGPQGMAIGPRPTTNDVLLGCNAASVPSGLFNSLIVLNFSPSTNVRTLLGAGGADQVWFDPVATHYFVTGGSLLPTQSYFIVDAFSNNFDQMIPIGTTGATTRRSHSTASWSGFGLGSTVTAAFVPVSATGGSTTAPFMSTVCGAQAAQGCVAVFATVPVPRPGTDPADSN